MKSRLLILLLGLMTMVPFNTTANNYEKFYLHDHQDGSLICSYDHGNPITSIYVSSASKEAETAISNIVDAIGLYTRFEVKSSNIPTAAATIINNKRYILYNQKFMTALTSASKNDWASVSILAHEIGHHLNGHTLDGSGLAHDKELEADEFSGFVLRKLGASVTDAQQALAIIADPHGSKSHPSRDTRLKAIAKGWNKADKQMTSPVVAKNPYERTAEQIERAEKEKEANRPVKEQQLAEQYIVSRVHMTNAPAENFYITTGSNFVKESKAGLVVLGKIQKNRSAKYPFAIINGKDEYILINDKGNLMTKEGKVIGYLKS